MEKCCVSIVSLYNKFGEHLPSGNTVDVSWNGYCDLRDKRGNLVCMDGEECEVEYESDSKTYRFINRGGEIDTAFYLTKEEFDHAVFCLTH